MEREVGGGIRMGNTCKPMAVSFQCMTKTTTNKKKKLKKKKKRKKKRYPGGGNGNPTPVFLPGESHGQRSLVGYSP